MKWIKWIFFCFVAIVLIAMAVLRFGPVQNVDWTQTENPASGLALGDIDAYLSASEAKIADIKPDQQKQVIWASSAGARSEIAIVYIHGFSASLQEIRPVPDQVAQAFEANIFYTRLKGHGRPGEAMAEAHLHDWMRDLEEAITIGDLLGEKLVVMATSNGAALATLALERPDLAEKIDAFAFFSSNYRVADGMAWLAGLAYFDKWGPRLAGEWREWEPANALHGAFWTTGYPTKSVVPMMRLLAHVEGIDVSQTDIPALFFYSPQDKVSDQSATQAVIADWGGETLAIEAPLGEGVDPYHHVLAGDILSPANTEFATQEVIEFLRGALR